MVTIRTKDKLGYELVKEAILNHGFKKFREIVTTSLFFGTTYIIEIEFIPSITFLEHLLKQAERTEDYINAAGIKKMIDIKKDQQL